MALCNKLAIALAVLLASFNLNAATTLFLNGKSLTAWNGATLTAWNGSSGVVTTSAAYLINQNFEGTGYDNSESWSGSWDADYATAPAPLVGSQSAHATTAIAMTSPSFTASGDVWVYFQLYFNARIDNTSIFDFRNATPASVASISTRPGSLARCSNGTVNSSDSVGTFTTGTKYHCWGHYVKGTGANGFMSFGWSTTGTKPTSGNNYVQVTTGTATTDVTAIRFNGAASQDMIIDHVLVSTSTIGDNP
jgi:hypothetical protein